MDVRHPRTEFDQMLLDWADTSDMPTHILLTKADKLSKSRAKSTLLQVQQAMADWQDLVSVQLFSSLKKTGLEEVATKINQWLSQDIDVV